MSVSLKDLELELNELLNPASFRDYCPNGLQVEGKHNIRKIVSGVTASTALIEAALSKNADALLVHHGYFWRGENQNIVGMKRNRLKLLLDNELSLFAYHLPLDAHPLLGNNAQLGKLLGIETVDRIGPQGESPLVNVGRLPQPVTAAELTLLLSDTLGKAPVVAPGSIEKIQTVAWCTGAAQNYFELAANANVDAYITGEISEPSAHIASESGVHFFAAGHHATERYGVQAVGEYLQEKFGLEHEFIDIDNPA